MYLVVTARKGVSSLQLAKQIGVTQKTAWFLLGRLREACGDPLAQLSGTVEVDEVYIGGREQNKHESKKLKAGRGTVGKQAVLGLRERGGKSVAVPVEGPSKDVLQTRIAEFVEAGSTVCSDEHKGYEGLAAAGYQHGSVKHSAGEYVGANDIHINGTESMWAVFRRSLYGTWHHCSRKHLARYLNETTFRLNEGTVTAHTLERLVALTDKAFQQRIMYKELTA